MNHFFNAANTSFFLSLHSTIYLCRESNRYITTQEIAERLNASANHLQKIHQRLVKGGILIGQRGPSGGFRLNKPADKITLLELYCAVKNERKSVRCMMAGSVQNAPGGCILGDFFDLIDRLIINQLKTLTVAQVARSHQQPFENIVSIA